jgi:hypothetical protein
MPPLELRYSRPTIDAAVRTLEDGSYEHLPVGVDGAQYRWLDPNSEGLSGVLTEQGGAWWYQPNLGDGRLGAQHSIVEKPTVAIASGVQFMDLAGDGLLDVVRFESPGGGFFERTSEDRWAAFTPFRTCPNIDWDNPNLRFVDLTGDGQADVLITEDDIVAWHPALAEDGYGPRESTRMAADDSRGPRVVFNDATDTILLADMSGDGLADLVRVRNGEVCYWPNLGYGRFGARITMDDAPVFDMPDLFEPRRLDFTTQRVIWGRQLVGTALELLETPQQRGQKLGTIGLLDELLGRGPVPVTEIKAAAVAHGISWPTVERAKKQMNTIIAKRDGKGWCWCLNTDGLGASF